MLIVISCSNENKKEKLTQLVNEWQGKEITITKDIHFTRFAKDIIPYFFGESEYKIITEQQFKNLMQNEKAPYIKTDTHFVIFM